ncbi:MAG: F0F1 ATP synthase subunit gamma [Candidatus Omnitrophica bacterium]|nr:F0F1 ATP synthase subunit gamma [Candidatus Omnitrophota bacterium]
MIPIGKLKQNMLFNKDLGDLIEVMKLAASAQFNRFRYHQEPKEEFYTLLNSAYSSLPLDVSTDSFFNLPSNLPRLIVLVSSDGGFLGEQNALLFNHLLDIKRQQDEIIVLGQQGISYLNEAEISFISFESPGDKLDTQKIGLLRDYLAKRYFNQEISQVNVIYSKFINITTQQVEIEILLPLERKKNVAKGKEILIEPDSKSVLEGWIKLWLDFRFYHIFWSSKLSEFAARIMHLEGSVQELGKINQRLQLEYFKYLHALSDKSIRELSAARLARRNN